MDTLLIRERYKVVQVLETRENYAFAEAVDILDREKNSYLLNIYEGPLLRIYLPCFDQLRTCPDFQGVFLEGESLVAVFRYRTGTPIDQVFYRGDKHDWSSRLEYAQQLLHQVLNMADLPHQVSCAALLSENVLINENSASASEIFAGAVKDYGAATLVGTRSYGKGVVQSILDLGDGTAVKLTVSKYYTPNGNNIDGVGIEPDVEVEIPEEAYLDYVITFEEDAQLQTAIELLSDAQ